MADRNVMLGFLIAGAFIALVFAWAVFWAVTNVTRQRSYRRAIGTVIDVVQRASSNGYIFHPVIQFLTSSSQTVQFESNFGTRPSRYKRGDTVPIRYHPENPKKAYVDRKLDRWFGPVLLASLASIGLIVYVGVFLVFMLR